MAKKVSSIGQTIALDRNINPVKVGGTEKLLPRLAQTLDGMRKDDPPTMKKLPVEADVPEYLVKQALTKGSTEKEQAVADLTLIAFYYLLRVEEYTVKGTCNSSKQTQQFKLKDVTFFRRGRGGRLRQLPPNASTEEIMTADSCTLKLDNQKNGWKGVCVNHHANGDVIFCPVQALGRRYLHLRKHHKGDWKIYLSAYFEEDGLRRDVTNSDISKAIKVAATMLDYPDRGIPIDRVDTHSLRGGGANALSLAGYSDRHIQKMGRWRGETFKEYISEHLSEFSSGMSKSMMKTFGFVHVAGGVFQDITNTVVATEYTINPSAAPATAA